MNTRTQLLSIAVSLAALSFVVWWTARDRFAGAEAGDSGVAAPSTAEPELVREPVRAPAVEEPVRREAALPVAPSETPAATATLRGRVTDTAARAVAGLDVRFVYSSERAELAELAEPFRATTDAAGAFELPVPTGYGRLVAENEEWITLLDVPLWLEGPPEDPTIVVALRCSYSGVVVDEAGQPLDQVFVRAVMDRALLRGLRPGVQRSEFEPRWSARTDASGAFELPDVGWSEGLRLEIVLGGYEGVSLLLPQRSDSDMRVVMFRPRSGPQAFEGIVVDPEGASVADAVVFAGETVTRSDRQGNFVLDRAGVELGDKLCALKPGFLPAELEVTEGAQTALVLRLGEPPLSISGRVVDARGNPVPEVHVWTHEGSSVPRNEANAHRHVEDVIGFEDGLLTNRHRFTADDGVFELSGLLPQAYRVWAAHSGTLEIIDAGPVEAGTSGLVLAFTEVGARRVAGRVVSFAGDPIPGVWLFFGSDELRSGTPFYTPLMTGHAPQSDAEGRFEFEALCVAGTYLLPAGVQTSVSDEVYLDQLDDLENIVIRLPRPCVFQILLEQDPDEADQLRVLDGEGNVLSLMVQTGTTTLSTNWGMGLVGGRSDLITTDERAKTLVLTKAGAEVRRIPLTLEPGEVQVLRY